MILVESKKPIKHELTPATNWAGTISTEGNFLTTLKPFLLVIDALDYAHNQGVYHGDLKSNNILLNKRGKPVLIDFGISFYQPNKKNEDCSPASSDIFSLGILIHEILVGVPPKNNKIIDDSVEKKSSRKIKLFKKKRWMCKTSNC